MNFLQHSELVGKHAFLSASNYHWVNYDEAKLMDRFYTSMEAARGTRLHELASELIQLGIKLPRNNQTLNMYVNDAIGYKMTTEQILYYSRNAFGTVDAISFKKNLLRIHDLKNGVNKASVTQLMVYAAFFCLEYGFKPAEIEMELRIYQNDEVKVYFPEVHEITVIMDRIKTFDKRIEMMRMEAGT